MQLPCLHNYVISFLGFKNKKDLISLYRVGYKIASTLKLLDVAITGLYLFLNDGINEEDYEHINPNILHGNVINLYLIIV